LKAPKRARTASGKAPLEWDDLRFVLAVADSGSLAGAAAALRVNRTTMLRRINAFERGHAVRIFDRLARGHYALNAAGDEVVAAARAFESAIATIERSLAGRDLRAEGRIRVTTTDTLMASVLPRILAAFQEANPAIELEINASNMIVNLSSRDADVAIRPVIDAPEASVGRRICEVAFAIYSSVSSGRAMDQVWIAPSDTLANTTVAQWMRTDEKARPIIRVDSLLLMRELCAAGAGLAALPCYLGDSDARIARVGPPIKEMTSALWVLTHPDLARTTRVRLFVDHLTTSLRRERPLIEGLRGRI
jgi:DNA-binding transcriptional LysR family regulator